ncbi:hypothetical protein LWI28_019473 [Acer negundo]|uniref:Uncharacterized protein n=1 Tax=Acer negundo TaxID=4023 RepID=A0AAD5IF58_ACENE|nr:hypothetical protein LWI28_019473 [Acer negundo]
MSGKEPYYYDFLGVDEESTKLGSCSGASLSTNFNQSQNATNFVTALAGASSSSGPGEAPIQNLFKIEPNQTDVSKGRITLSNEFVNKHIVPYLNESQKEILPRREAFHISTVDDQSHQLYEMSLGQNSGYYKCLRKAKKFIRNKNLQIRKMPGLKQKKAHLMEIQVNGGDVAKKVEYAYSFFEKHLPIDVVFQKDEMIDIIASNTNETQNAATNSAVAPAGASNGPREAPIQNYFTKKLTPSDLNRNSIFVLAKSSVEEHILPNLNEIDKAKLKDEVAVGILVVDNTTYKRYPMKLINQGNQYHLRQNAALVRDNKLEVGQQIEFRWHDILNNTVYVNCKSTSI